MLLWPFIWLHKSTLPDDHETRYFVIAPLFWKYRTLYTDGEYKGNSAHNVTLFPLVTWRKEANGSWHFFICSSGWKDKTGGFKRNYRAFFDFFQYHSLADGEKETRLLSRP